MDKPIILHVYSSTCPDLTLVDLPGITRIALQGQDANIEKVTTEMAKRYIDDPQTIILAVIPANADITTSDSLMLAKKADQKGERTLGVITKIDIMDRGVDAKGMILGKEVPLKLGYVGIVGRSQQDIKDKKPVKSHLVDEQVVFPEYIYHYPNSTLLEIFLHSPRLLDPPLWDPRNRQPDEQAHRNPLQAHQKIHARPHQADHHPDQEETNQTR